MSIATSPMLNGTRSTLRSPHLLNPRATISRNVDVLAKGSKSSRSTILESPLILRQSSGKMSSSSSKVTTCINATNPAGSGQEDNCAALDTVLKLYTAIKHQNVREISDVIADECRCVCNFFSFFQPFHGKQQVLDFFAYLIRILGNNVEFIVKPTLHDGLHVGVSWRLEWNQTHMPLGKGFGFYICQIYQGKVVIRNVEMFMEPLLHLEPLRLKLLPYAMVIIDKISSFGSSEDKLKKVVLFLSMVAVVALFLKPGMY